MELRPVEILVGTKSIAEAFGVGRKTVKRWREDGAPIYADARGVPRAEKAELWRWFSDAHGKKSGL